MLGGTLLQTFVRARGHRSPFFFFAARCAPGGESIERDPSPLRCVGGCAHAAALHAPGKCCLASAPKGKTAKPQTGRCRSRRRPYFAPLPHVRAHCCDAAALTTRDLVDVPFLAHRGRHFWFVFAQGERGPPELTECVGASIASIALAMPCHTRFLRSLSDLPLHSNFFFFFNHHVPHSDCPAWRGRRRQIGAVHLFSPKRCNGALVFRSPG